MSTCNRLDLGTLGCQPIRPKNLPDHRFDDRDSRRLVTDEPVEFEK
jgi:hypothetical protein